jgi:membrane protease YdiL (CAAX protease family)
VRIAAAVVATALAVLLVVVVPPLGRLRHERWRLRLAGDPSRRTGLYGRTLLTQWGLVAVVAVVGILAARSPASVGLRWHDTPFLVGAAVAFLGAAALVSTGARGDPDRVVETLARQPRVLLLLPRTRRERRAYAMVAITAGVCEEVVYRGFGIAYARWALPAASSTEVVLLVAAAFGLAHLYQGRRGMVGTFLAGVVLGAATVVSGSLLPAILLHCLVDLRPLLFRPEDVADAERLGATAPPAAPSPS